MKDGCRTEHINIRVTPSEREMAERVAESEALSLSAFLRRVIILSARQRGLLDGDNSNVEWHKPVSEQDGPLPKSTAITNGR